MAVKFSDLGLVNSRELFAKAIESRYAIPAFNFENMEQIQAIIQACTEIRSPAILQISPGALKYVNPTFLRHMAQGAVEYAKELGNGKNVPMVLHLDHGTTFDLCKDCVESGFSSVMIDGSRLPYEENIDLTRKVVDYAHKYDVTVEGELGVLDGIEDGEKTESYEYTQPEQVEDFIEETGCDSLAVSIGTNHGAHKFRSGQEPKIRLDILAEIEKCIPGFPIVLHGSSSVPQDLVHIINLYGGQLKDAIGIPEEQLRLASKSSVCKINIASDGRLVTTAMIRKFFSDVPEEFDPRRYSILVRNALKELYIQKCNIFGSSGHAFD